MTGAQLKHQIKIRGLTMKTVAQKTGQKAKNPGNKLARDDVSSSLVESVAEVIGFDLADCYRQLDKAQVQIDRPLALLEVANPRIRFESNTVKNYLRTAV